MPSGVANPSTGDRVTVTVSDGFVVAKDEETGVASQGETKIEALANLAEALELYERPVDEDDDPDETATAPWL